MTRGHSRVIIRKMKRDREGSPEKVDELPELIDFKGGITITRL